MHSGFHLGPLMLDLVSSFFWLHFYSEYSFLLRSLPKMLNFVFNINIFIMWDYVI